MNNRKIVLTLTQGLGYKVTGIINSIEWNIGEYLRKDQVQDIIKYRPDVTVKIVGKK
jgi:hypothetical protein